MKPTSQAIGAFVDMTNIEVVVDTDLDEIGNSDGSINNIYDLRGVSLSLPEDMLNAIIDDLLRGKFTHHQPLYTF